MNDTLQKLWDTLIELSASVGLKILLAIAVLVIGLLLIKYLVKFIVKSKGFNKIDKTVQTFIKSCLLYTSDAADDLLCVDLGGCRILKKKK